MEGVVADGKARYAGTATGLASSATIVDRGQTFPAVLQLVNSVVRPLPDGAFRGRAVITHGSLSGLEDVRAAVDRSPSLAESWSAQLGLALTDPGALSRLALRFAARGPARVVVFSSTSMDQVRENVRDVGDPWMDDDQLSRFAQLVEAVRQDPG
jgi:hypothetical protein